MTSYAIRRVLQAIPTLLIISFIGFMLIHSTGDPLAAYTVDASLTAEDIAELRARYGLDKPVPVQYLNWLKNMLTGDWGRSFYWREKVSVLFFDWLPNTLLLVAVSYSMTLIVAIVLGIVTATHQYSWLDHVVTTISFAGISMPSFWLGLMLIYGLAVLPKTAGWSVYLPVGGMFDVRGDPSLKQFLWHVILPAFTLSFVQAARYVRYIRSAILEELNQDYVRTARAKGLRERIVLVVHVFKNALLPVITLVGLSLPYLLSGTIVIESIFAWPGMGRLFWRAAERVDIPVLMASLMFVSTTNVVVQLLTDLAYAAIDPRIRYDR